MIIAICDDNSSFRKQLQKELEEYYHNLDMSIHPFASGEALLNEFGKKEYDLIFLDIEMDGIDGLETARRIRTKNQHIPIILLTSHTEFAVAGYEVQAFRFLSKPLEHSKLIQALQAIEMKRHDEKKIIITVDGIQKFILCKNIKYIKSENVYLNLVMNNTSFLIRKKQKELMQELPKDLFAPVHRSYIINLMYVDSFDGKTVLLDDGTDIPVARGHREGLKEQIMRYFREK